MTSYDTSHFDPPAPVAHVTLRNPQNGATVSDVVLLLDTGSDITLLPSSTVEQLGVSPLTDQSYDLMGFDGTRSSASIVILDMIFLMRIFRG
ncbi:aspartyl protease family protein [Candidatus Entotheonella palauensis]|uniref:aspartyl protease family protein n=1 Tax=Candidatus Entotheonella palauensis TaxID=93172 RepID=UPI000B7F0353